ncbi:MAG: class C sortase [Ruminococcaceae bacterium]|jgi:sortase A|nr:class C sortase [Oscillospiraceae bacterium]
MKNRITNIFLVLAFFIGVGLLLYPSFSDYWNSFHQSRAIASYADEIAAMDTSALDEIRYAAQEYNRRWAEVGGTARLLKEDELADYESQLNFNGSGMMGYIEIPAIKCYLGIYHGTSDAVLQIATGHLEWSSLPVGGESTHAVISGHRGLPSAKLFTELDKLRVGDRFSLYILGEEYSYEVDQINIVLPEDVELMKIYPGEDYVTLVTCTPYGINTHRLLVRGTRVENIVDHTLHFTSEAMKIDPLVVTPVVMAPILLLLLLVVALGGNQREKKRRDQLYKAALAYLNQMEENPMMGDYDLWGEAEKATEKDNKKPRGKR